MIVLGTFMFCLTWAVALLCAPRPLDLRQVLLYSLIGPAGLVVAVAAAMSGIALEEWVCRD